MELFETYIQSLQKHDINDVTEHTYRKELQSLLEELAEKEKNKITVQHEPKRKEGFGAPDFKIKSVEAILGYVENKKLTENLDKTLKSNQIKKYKSLSNNILLTNYIEWVWIKGGDIIDRAKLCDLSDIESRMSFLLSPGNVERVRAIISNFYKQTPKGIERPKQLASILAIRARFLRDFLREELERQATENTKERLFGLYETFKENIFTELTIKEFSDAFSQTLVYGLFLSKLNAGEKTIDLYNAKKFILPAFGLISELVEFLDVLDNENYKDVKWIVEDVLSVMNTLNLQNITKNLSYKKYKTTDLFKEESTSYIDPYIYFYEHFLAAYDKKLKKSKGVYYTPPQVVNFITRSINQILKNIFGIDNGYADKDKVTVLDFATGTGSFLVEILEQIFEDLPKGSGKKNLVIRDHILKNFYGFEYLIAPYTVAVLKLSQFLKDHGYELKDDDRFQIYLTNTLEPVSKQLKIPLLPTLSKESKAAQKVKDNPILIITGNPPYSHHSKNKGEWISRKIKDYYFVDGKKLAERNPKALQDDYVKFIRFAQWKMDQVEEGIVGIITNHTFLFNLTFPGMRQQLMKTFDQLYFLDLHGNKKMKEKTPEGDHDENIFDIEQGVAISIFIKKPGLEKKIFHSDLWGKREEKYDFCLNASFSDVDWEPLYPSSPFYLFRKLNEKIWNVYKNGLNIKTEIFVSAVQGVTSSRDSLAVAFDASSLERSIRRLIDQTASESDLENELGIKNTGTWKIEDARKALIQNGRKISDHIKEYYYRPFDYRKIFYHKSIVERQRLPFMNNMLKDNISITIGRAGQAVEDSQNWNLVHCSNSIIDKNLFYRGGTYILPLYIYEGGLFSNKGQELNRRINFQEPFKRLMNDMYGGSISENKIFGYLFAILHSPTYREKYNDFLKIDFPRISFIENKEKFNALSKLGWEIIHTHLFKKTVYVKDYPFGIYKGEGDNTVQKRDFIEYSKERDIGKIFINNKQHFDRVPKSVWEFYIGGYQILDKYLKDRTKRKLNLSEIENIEKIIRVLRFTIDKMEEIDKLTKKWI